MCVYMYTYIVIYIYTHTYIYIYIPFFTCSFTQIYAPKRWLFFIFLTCVFVGQNTTFKEGSLDSIPGSFFRKYLSFTY